MENDSFLDPSESMLIKRILNVASGYAALKTFIDNNIYIIGADRALSGESLADAVNYLCGRRFQLSQQYISRGSCLSQMSWLALVSTQPPIQRVTGLLSQRVKQPGLEADLSPPCSAEVKNE
jgi:hypothetical protein